MSATIREIGEAVANVVTESLANRAEYRAMSDDEFLKAYVIERIKQGGGGDGTICAEQAAKALRVIATVR